MPKLGMKEIRREQVIKSVLKCVEVEGIEKVTLDKVAKMAKVSKGIVSYYFNNKETLLIESFQSFLNQYLNIPKESYKAREILISIGEVVLGMHPESKILMQIFSQMTISHKYKAMLKEVYTGYYNKMIELLIYGEENKEFKIENKETTAMQLLALLDGLIIFSTMEFNGSREDLLKNYTDFVNRL